MRRTLPVLRGSKGYSWYTRYKKDPESFAKRVSPTPFDWTVSDELCKPAQRPIAYFTFATKRGDVGTLEFELASDILPRTVENFCKLITGDNEFRRNYLNTQITKIAKGVAIMGGDVVNNDGTGSHSAYAERFIKDENFAIHHTDRGLISMASVGRDTCGSVFYIGLGANLHMNGRCPVIGRLVGGADVLDKIENVYTMGGKPYYPIFVADCGLRTQK